MAPISINQEQTKEIETTSLTIKGNYIVCDNLIIQTSNVSSFEAVNTPHVPFPLWTIVGILIGLCSLSQSPLFGTIILAVSGFCIFTWYSKNAEAKSQKFLYIVLNSNQVIRILFKDLNFLQKVLDCIKEILLNPENIQEYHINIKGNTIHGGSIMDNVYMGTKRD